MDNKNNMKVLKEGIFILLPLLILNYVAYWIGFNWATYPYQTILILVFSIVFVYSKNILNRKINIYKKSRFTMILIGAISSITLISGIRDIMSGHLKIIVNEVLSVEFCHIIISLFFLVLFISYTYIEIQNREIIIKMNLKGDEAERANNDE